MNEPRDADGTAPTTVEALIEADPTFAVFPRDALERHLKNLKTHEASSSASHPDVKQDGSGLSDFQGLQDFQASPAQRPTSRFPVSQSRSTSPAPAAAPVKRVAPPPPIARAPVVAPAGAAVRSDGKGQPDRTPQGPLLALLQAEPPLDEYIVGLFHNADVLCMVHFEWQNPVFSFARWAKAHPDLTLRTAPDAWAEVADVVAELGDDADEVWETHFECGEEDAEIEFLDAWTRVRSLPTADPLEYALALADAYPLALRPDVQSRARSSDYPRFVSLAGYLQRNVGAETPIFLPTERLGELLGVKPTSISRYCKWAAKDGYLVRTKAAVFIPAKGVSRAAEYLFNLEAFDGLTSDGI